MLRIAALSNSKKNGEVDQAKENISKNKLRNSPDFLATEAAAGRIAPTPP